MFTTIELQILFTTPITKKVLTLLKIQKKILLKSKNPGKKKKGKKREKKNFNT